MPRSAVELPDPVKRHAQQLRRDGASIRAVRAEVYRVHRFEMSYGWWQAELPRRAAAAKRAPGRFSRIGKELWPTLRRWEREPVTLAVMVQRLARLYRLDVGKSSVCRTLQRMRAALRSRVGRCEHCGHFKGRKPRKHSS